MIALEVLSPSTSPTSLSTKVLSVGASVPVGNRGKVHIRGQNNMATPQEMGCTWVVKDPEGRTVEEHTDDWAGWPWPTDVDPNDTHEFISFLDEGFDLDKVGTYTIAVDLLMNPDSPVIVDSYQGDLCTTTLEVPPEFELIQHTIFPYAYIYDGKTDFSIFTFKTPSFIPTDWAAKKFAEAVESEVKKAGGRVIDLKVYVDEAGPFDLWENFRIEVEGTPLGAAQGVGVSVGIPLWAAILIIALSIALLIVVITWSIDTITKSFTHKPGLHEVKPGWGKETLMLTIHDSEEYWERPLTPAETLEGMSEDELRDYLDQIAEEEVKKEFPWGLVVIGGVAVLGVGAAVALTAAAKPRE